jgi:hypothetical protein
LPLAWRGLLLFLLALLRIREKGCDAGGSAEAKQ